jgi:antitoxin CptB
VAETQTLEFRKRRAAFRAWHRGTREADLMIGGFADACLPDWAADDLDWFEALLEEQDVDVMAWAIGKQPVPARFAGAQMERLQRLDTIARAMR